MFDRNETQTIRKKEKNQKVDKTKYRMLINNRRTWFRLFLLKILEKKTVMFSNESKI